MRILGIDPGTRRVGIGAIDNSGRTPVLVSACVLSAPASQALPARLHVLADQLAESIRTLAPDVVAIEKAFFGRNVATLIALGEGRGVALLRAAEVGLPIHEYSPAEVKKAVAGSGGARKEQVAKMVAALLSTDGEFGLDATDALAVALCHANRMRFAAITADAPSGMRFSRGRRRGRSR